MKIKLSRREMLEALGGGRHVWPGWRICGADPRGCSRCGPWQLCGPRAAGEASTSS
jgi:hypothetical protein